MAKGNLRAVLSETLVHEGGYVDHPKDRGGATSMGITFAVLQGWRKTPIGKADVRNLTRGRGDLRGGLRHPVRGKGQPRRPTSWRGSELGQAADRASGAQPRNRALRQDVRERRIRPPGHVKYCDANSSLC